MTGTESIFAVVAVVGALVLAVRGLNGHNLSKEKVVRYALIWAAIIGGFVLLLSVAGV